MRVPGPPLYVFFHRKKFAPDVYTPFFLCYIFFFFSFKVEKKTAIVSNVAPLFVTGLGMQYRVSVASGLDGRKRCGLIAV